MTIRVEVLYALPERQWTVALELPDDATVRMALEAPQVRAMLDASRAQVASLGVWGRTVQPDHRLRNHDRLEIYRTLLIDPQSARRKRAMSASKKR